MPTEKKPKKPKVVLDTNVIVSGLNFSGKERKILDLIWEGEIELYISPFILEETAGVLQRKFDWEKEEAQSSIKKIKASLVKPIRQVSIIKERKSDNRILECAIEGKVQYLISGDKRHLLPLKEYQGIRILSPAEFLELL
jgi:putative PIN family toxin of toxin-antitoxin system